MGEITPILAKDSKGNIIKDKNGNDIYNLPLKTKVDPLSGEVFKGLTDGDSITVEKIFERGYESKQYPGSFSCKVKFMGKDCSFFLSGDTYKAFEKTGGVGDQVVITGKKMTRTFQGKEIPFIGYSFKLVE